MKKLKIGAEVRVKMNEGTYQGRVHGRYEKHGQWIEVNLSPKGTRNPNVIAVRPARVTPI